MNRLFISAITLTAAFIPISAATSQTVSPTMKAIVVQQPGGPETLKLQEVPRPQPKADEVLIKVMAAGVNPVDAYIRAGRYGGAKSSSTPGMDVAGVIESTGANAKKFKKGDAVYAYLSFTEQGGYAEYCIARESEVALKPTNLTFEQAAGVPLAGTTAWQALIDTAGMKSGQTVLIHGGSGGVGHLAIQLAKARGAKVIATASTANQDFLKQMGADETIDYTRTKFEDVVKDVDIVLDCTRSDALSRSYGVVKKGGFIVSITGQPDQTELKKREIRGDSLMAHPDFKVLEEFTKLIEAKKITPVVSQTFALAEANKAHQQIETRHTRGKVVLKVADVR
ncbi:MAG TPA: NADP-dependent oxidoreductase [Chthoniobacterales bacterium]|nr:NADP-dependent oxidoreductase [Chthoniobacterales bacterium]